LINVNLERYGEDQPAIVRLTSKIFKYLAMASSRFYKSVRITGCVLSLTFGYCIGITCVAVTNASLDLILMHYHENDVAINRSAWIDALHGLVTANKEVYSDNSGEQSC